MAYVSKEDKAEVFENIKPILKKYGIKATLSVHGKIELILTIWESPIDFIGNFNQTANERYWDRFEPITDNYMEVNQYHLKDQFSGIAYDALLELVAGMQTKDWYCNDDVMSDFFSRKYFYSVKIGRWNKPYIFKPNKSQPVPAAIQATPNEENEVSENMYSTMTNNEMIEQLVAMGPVIDSAIDLAPTFDVSSMVKQLTDMIEQMESEISFRMSQYQTAE